MNEEFGTYIVVVVIMIIVVVMIIMVLRRKNNEYDDESREGKNVNIKRKDLWRLHHDHHGRHDHRVRHDRHGPKGFETYFD